MCKFVLDLLLTEIAVDELEVFTEVAFTCDIQNAELDVANWCTVKRVLILRLQNMIHREKSMIICNDLRILNDLSDIHDLYYTIKTRFFGHFELV